jgi:alpha-beta hydrolase superfamily lysophospholipase
MVHRPFPSVALLSLVAFAAITACSGGNDAPSITGTAAPTTTTVPFTVTGDDLYTPPDPLPAGAHGDLIWAQPVAQWWGSPRRAWQVLYLSAALDGRAIAVSGFVIAPPEGSDGDDDGDRPVVAWAHETVGSADSCAPSRTFAAQERTDDPGLAVAAQLTDLVDGGAVVVASDYEGLGTPGPHPFLVGESEGRSVLDAVQAARRLPGTGAGDDVLVYGASQGGHAALWAAQLASTWTPDLRVLGVVAAAPFSEVDLLLPAASLLPGGEGYVALGAYGQVAANPELSVDDVLDPAIVAQADLVESACLLDVSVQLRQTVVAERRPVARLDGFEDPAWKAQLTSIKPGRAPIGAPTLVVQGARDLTVPAATTQTLVTRLCANGENVRAVTYPQAGHSDVVVAADADVRAWMQGRLAGVTLASGC